MDVLTDSMKSVYTTIRDATGVAGIGDTEGVQRQEISSSSHLSNSAQKILLRLKILRMRILLTMSRITAIMMKSIMNK